MQNKTDVFCPENPFIGDTQLGDMVVTEIDYFQRSNCSGVRMSCRVHQRLLDLYLRTGAS